MMRRLGDWWSAFWPQIKPPTNIKAIVTYIVFLAGFFGYSITHLNKWEGWKNLGLYSAYLLLIPVAILTWLAAIAWERTRTPNIRIGELEEYEKDGYWSLSVENDGEQTVTARATAIRLTDKDGKNTEIIDWSLPLVWGRERHKEAVLSRGIPGKLRIFTLSSANKQELPLLLRSYQEKPEEWEGPWSHDNKIPICREEDKGDERILTIVVVFDEIKSSQDRRSPRKEMECQFRIKYDETHPLKFRIEKIT